MSKSDDKSLKMEIDTIMKNVDNIMKKIESLNLQPPAEIKKDKN